MESKTHDKYWVLKGCGRDFFVCATPYEEYMALCVFDSEIAAERHLRGLSESQMFLDTLEWYGASVPSWVRRESLLPRVCEVSRRELWEIIETLHSVYVVVNPPLAWRKVETLELRPSQCFRAE
jgi:hypothetical protein